MEISVGALTEDEDTSVMEDSPKKVDRFSDLPEDILSYILSFLTVRIAVKTRLLSSRWRYLCASRSDFQFDLLTVFGINYHRIYFLKHLGNLWEDKLRFVRAVNQFLQLCRSQRLSSFTVCYCLGNESACDIDWWVSFAVKMRTEKLDLNFSFIPQGIEYYNFPCHLLPQDKGSLKHLCLQSCILRPSPDFRSCLNSLKFLELNDVPLDQISFDNILFGCLNLESLILKNCRLPESFFICGQWPSLKLLVLDYCRGTERIVISSIDLLTFEYIGEVTNLSFVGVWSLEKVHLNFMYAYERGSKYMFDGLAKDLPQLQIMSLVLTTDEVLPIPSSMTTFSHLKELDLTAFLSTDFNLLSITSILDASPCLQKLHLSLHCVSFRGKMRERECSKKLHYQLKEVRISGFCKECNTLKLAIYLLNTAVKLECMIVSSQRRYYRGAGVWNQYNPKKMDEFKKKQVYDMLSKEKVEPDIKLIVQ